jgi:3-oxoacyl-[acyl-carrier-protein] synthase II
MLAGGSEAGITHFLISGLTRMNALSRRNDEPERASRPFDADRDGFVIAEGAGIMVLEALDHAKKRDAKIYAELAGYGYSGDAYHITAPHPEGDGASMAMREALNSSGLPIEAIGYINAHGTSTRFNDIIETKSIRRVFRESADRIPVSATKSMTGHLQAACGAVECIVSTLSVYHQRVHPTLNLETPDPECDLDYVPEGPRDLKIAAALSNSFGFGGHNVSLVVKKYPD